MAHVLIADDDKIIHHLYGSAFRQAGHSVGNVFDGNEVERVLSARPFDLLLLDWMMPEVSGFDVLRRLRMTAAFCRLPVIMLTARSSPEDREIAENAHVDLLFSKRSSPDWLVFQAEHLIVEKARVAPMVAPQRRVADARHC